LIDKRRHSNTLDVQSFRGADCDTDHCLVVAKVRERISVSKWGRLKFDLERFDLKKLHDIEVKEKYQVEMSNSFAALESSAKDNLGYHRLDHNKPWFNDECSKLVDKQKQAKLQWLQNPSQIIGDNLQNLRCETSRTFRKKKRGYLKGKINELETKTKILEMCTEA
jgi:hypothetical protein